MQLERRVLKSCCMWQGNLQQQQQQQSPPPLCRALPLLLLGLHSLYCTQTLDIWDLLGWEVP